jgi:transposase
MCRGKMTKVGWRAARRLAAVRRVRAGDTVEVVSTLYEVSPSTIAAWMRDADEEGMVSLVEERTSRPPALSARELRLLRERMEDTWMSARGFERLVQETFRRTISKAAALRYLARLGVVPARRARERFAEAPAGLERWRKEQLPILVERAAHSGASLTFVDATRIEEERPVRTAFTASELRGSFFYASFAGGPEPSIAAAFVRRVAASCPPLWLLAPNEAPFRAAEVPRVIDGTRLLLFPRW